MHMIRRLAAALRSGRAFATALRRDTGAVALLEFAFSLPIVLGIGAYGIEVSNMALVNLRISQIALNLADNASRVGATSGLSTQQLREVDVDDVLQAARYQGSSINLTTYGRITLSSLENVQESYDSAPVQRIHWQRCIGKKSGTNYDSTYGTTTTSAGTDATSANAGTTASSGMGDTGSKVVAPSGSGVMFVEINYLYQPLFASWLISNARIHYIASFIVRDSRDFSRLYNPSPTATQATCDKYAT
jgi:Flp pilus assembly protein TadG